MIKKLHVEPIKFREKYLSTPLLTKAEVEKAMDYVVAQTAAEGIVDWDAHTDDSEEPDFEDGL